MGAASPTPEGLAATRAAAQVPFLPLIYDLASTYQTLMRYSDKFVRQAGLTPAQFDVLVTLGNTEGMSMQSLAERTLVTKGTLTGIVDRLEERGFARREVPPRNRRSFTIVLTNGGQREFERLFPLYIEHLRLHLGQLSPKQIKEIRTVLQNIRQSLPLPDLNADVSTPLR